MKVIIAGSRTINEEHILYAAIKESGFDITEVVSGCAKGVGVLGEEYAKRHNIPIKSFPADWNLYNKAAGPIRNRLMAEYADAAIILWDGSSKGTRNLIDNMKRFDKQYYLLNISNES